MSPQHDSAWEREKKSTTITLRPEENSRFFCLLNLELFDLWIKINSIVFASVISMVKIYGLEIFSNFFLFVSFDDVSYLPLSLPHPFNNYANKVQFITHSMNWFFLHFFSPQTKRKLAAKVPRLESYESKQLRILSRKRRVINDNDIRHQTMARHKKPQPTSDKMLTILSQCFFPLLSSPEW
jgi:hypothetical protein